MSGRYETRVEVDDDHHVHLHTELSRADSCIHVPVLDALARHLGLHFTDLHASAKRPDPRYPGLTKLIRAARRSWDVWGAQLVERLEGMLRDGRLLPMRESTRRALEELFRDHVVRLEMRIAGVSRDAIRAQRLADLGLIEPAVAHTPVAYRLGRGLEMLEVHRLDPSEPSLDDLVEQALKVPLTSQDHRALSYAQQRAAIYIRRPAAAVRAGLEARLNEEELGSFRSTIAGAVGRKASSQALASELREVIEGPTASSDMDRIARTEMAFAHSFGAYAALKDQARAAGIADPLVYKFVAPGACTDCKRIWGPPSDPTRYRLSYIEAREAAGGNFRRPRREWGPVVGPVHPNCTEGPLQYWSESLVDAINQAADELDSIFGR